MKKNSILGLIAFACLTIASLVVGVNLLICHGTKIILDTISRKKSPQQKIIIKIRNYYKHRTITKDQEMVMEL